MKQPDLDQVGVRLRQVGPQAAGGREEVRDKEAERPNRRRPAPQACHPWGGREEVRNKEAERPNRRRPASQLSESDGLRNSENMTDK